MKKLVTLAFLMTTISSFAANANSKNCSLEISVKTNILLSTEYTPSGDVNSLGECVQLLEDFMVNLDATSGKYKYEKEDIKAKGTIIVN